MKKILSVLLVVCIIVPIGVGLAVLIRKKDANGIPANLLQGYNIDFEDATEVGIVSPIQISTLPEISKTSDSHNNNNYRKKNKLVTIDSHGNQNEVIFKKGGRSITQDQMEPYVDKLFITEEFMFFAISIVPSSREKLGSTYDYLNELNDAYDKTYGGWDPMFKYEFMQNYVVHRESGKIFYRFQRCIEVYGRLKAVG